MAVSYYAEEIKLPVYWFYGFLSATIFSFINALIGGNFAGSIVYIFDFELMFWLLVGVFLFPVGANILYFVSLKRNSAITTSIFLSLTPAFTVLESFLIFGERLVVLQFLGGALIIIASVLNGVEFKKTN